MVPIKINVPLSDLKAATNMTKSSIKGVVVPTATESSAKTDQ